MDLLVLALMAVAVFLLMAAAFLCGLSVGIDRKRERKPTVRYDPLPTGSFDGPEDFWRALLKKNAERTGE